MRKLVYLVMASVGSWDEYHQWVDAIFEKKEDAEEWSKNLNLKETENKNLKCPTSKEFLDSDLDLDFESLKVLPKDVQNQIETEFYVWWEKVSHAKEFNGSKVVTCPLNEKFDKTISYE